MTNKEKISIFGFSANPPANHHLSIIQGLTRVFDRVIVIPRGTSSNKTSTATTTTGQRMDMVKLIFSPFPDLKIDLNDLDNNIFTPTWMIDEKYKKLFPNSEVWHAVGGDLIEGGKDGNSEIQKIWQKGNEIWQSLNWAVIDHKAHPISKTDLPPKNLLVTIEKIGGRSTIIRNRVALDQSISEFVPQVIEKYIKQNDLYN